MQVAQTVQAALVVSVVCAVVLVPFWVRVMPVLSAWVQLLTCPYAVVVYRGGRALVVSQVLCGPVMQALHQHPSSATVSSDFLKYALIGLTQLLCYRVLAQYLRARHSVAALFAVNAAVLVMHYFISDLFVNGAGTWQGMGFVGVPLALAIAWTLQFVFSTVYLVVSGLMVELRAGVPTDALRPAAMADVVRAGKGLGFLEMLEMIVYVHACERRRLRRLILPWCVVFAHAIPWRHADMAAATFAHPSWRGSCRSARCPRRASSAQCTSRCGCCSRCVAWVARTALP